MAHPGSKIFKLFCFVLLVCMAVLQMQFGLRQQEIFIGKSDESRTATSRNATLLTNLATEKHLFEADLDQASLLLQKALIANPLHVPAWLALAVVRNDQGEKAQSTRILSYAHHLTTEIKRWRWDKVLTAYQLGQTEMLPVELSYIIREIPGKSRNAALQLAFTVWPDPAELVDNISQENLSHLFNYAYRTKDTGKTLYLYRVMDELDFDIERKNLLAAVEMLLRNGENINAGRIWRDKISSAPLLFNGDFSLPLTQTAFGWRTAKHPSAALTVEKIRGTPDKKGLHIRFKGWDNVNFHHLYQIVPLEPGTSYRFDARLKTDKITTDQRPFFEVYGYECKSFTSQKTEMFPPTADWQPVSVDFTIPEQCNTAIVRLRRLESNQIDSKISGNLWISDAAITEVDTPSGEEEQLQ